jgi:hypothetical protein
MADPMVCPYCGHSTLYEPDDPDWKVGDPYLCANPFCDTNHAPEDRHERT